MLISFKLHEISMRLRKHIHWCIFKFKNNLCCGKRDIIERTSVALEVPLSVEYARFSLWSLTAKHLIWSIMHCQSWLFKEDNDTYSTETYYFTFFPIPIPIRSVPFRSEVNYKLAVYQTAI